MVLGKAGMIGRVPVLGQHHRVEIGHQVIDRGHDFIAARDGQPAAGTEIGLHVDDDQSLAHLWTSGIGAFPKATVGPPHRGVNART